MPLIISTRALGRRKPLLDDFDFEPPAGCGEGDERTLREVIEIVVHQQVAAFATRQQTMRFDRVLSAADMEAGAARGKIDPAGKPDAPMVDAQDAVGAALQAFEDGVYLVVIDGVERRELDEPVRMGANSHITFIRLTFLAGA